MQGCVMVLSVLAALLIWGSIGLVIAAVLSRHGHNFFLLALMGLGYGPLLILIWLQSSSGQETGCYNIREATDASRPERVDVLVELDGTQGSIASAGIVLAAIGPAIGRVRFTSVIDHELFNSADVFQVDEVRADYLSRAADQLGHPEAELTLISGRRDKALRSHATANHFDIIVVGRTPRFLTDRLRGNTLSQLARHAEVPVIIGPAPNAATPNRKPEVCANLTLR